MDDALVIVILIIVAYIYFQHNPDVVNKPIFKKTSIFVGKCSTALKDFVSEIFHN